MTVFNEYLNGLLRFTIWGHDYSQYGVIIIRERNQKGCTPTTLGHARVKAIIINNLGLINFIVRAIFLIATLRDHEFDREKCARLITKY
jgi:hypothetical protein